MKKMNCVANFNHYLFKICLPNCCEVPGRTICVIFSEIDVPLRLCPRSEISG